MTSIINIGMDVHTTNFTLCAFTMAAQEAFARTTIAPDINELEKYLVLSMGNYGRAGQQSSFKSSNRVFWCKRNTANVGTDEWNSSRYNFQPIA